MNNIHMQSLKMKMFLKLFYLPVRNYAILLGRYATEQGLDIRTIAGRRIARVTALTLAEGSVGYQHFFFLPFFDCKRKRHKVIVRDWPFLRSTLKTHDEHVFLLALVIQT